MYFLSPLFPSWVAIGDVTCRYRSRPLRYAQVESGATADTGRGGSIYAATGVDLKVVSSNFTGGSASYAGSAIWCCGAELIDCFFNNLETSLSTVSVAEARCCAPANHPSCGGAGFDVECGGF